MGHTQIIRFDVNQSAIDSFEDTNQLAALCNVDSKIVSILPDTVGAFRGSSHIP